MAAIFLIVVVVVDNASTAILWTSSYLPRPHMRYTAGIGRSIAEGRQTFSAEPVKRERQRTSGCSPPGGLSSGPPVGRRRCARCRLPAGPCCGLRAPCRTLTPRPPPRWAWCLETHAHTQRDRQRERDRQSDDRQTDRCDSRPAGLTDEALRCTLHLNACLPPQAATTHLNPTRTHAHTHMHRLTHTLPDSHTHRHTRT